MQPLFHQRAGLSLRFLFFLIASLVLMLIDHRYSTFQNFRSHISTVLIYPLQYMVDIPVRVYHWSSDSLSSREALMEENKTLQKLALEHQVRLQILDGLEKENARLRELLKSSPKVGEDVLVAELLTIDLDPYKKQIVLNKGKSHGVYLGQPVIDAHGVIGQISMLGEFSSTALLISDPGHALPVQIVRTDIRTIAQGTRNPNELELLHLPNNADIQIGDLIVTSGLAGRFPPNYPVAVISHIEILPNKPFAKVKATPMASLDKTREVLLVWPTTRPDA